MAVKTSEGEVAFRVVIKNRRIVRVEEAEGTEGKVEPLSPEQKDAYDKSAYGCRRLETIYETKQNPCFVCLGGFRIEVPCP